MNVKTLECFPFPNSFIADGGWTLIFKMPRKDFKYYEVGNAEIIYASHPLDGRLESIVEKHGSPIGFGICLTGHRFLIFEFPNSKEADINES